MPTEKKICEGVYFLSLTLENVRCFSEKQTLDLSDGNGRPAQWTVILGDNGVGKTTLLEVLKKHTALIDGSETQTLPRKNAEQYFIEYTYASGGTLDDQSKEFKVNSYRWRDYSPSTTRRKVAEFMNSKIPVAAQMYTSNNIQIHLYSYWANRKPEKYNFSFKPTTPDTLTRSEDELIKAEEWLLSTDYIANKPSEIQDTYKERFQIIKDVLIKLLPNVEDIQVSEPTANLPLPRVQFKTADGWLLFYQLSLGYQTMTTWMVDLAARLFDTYPNSPNPIAEPAVVLIDEIDLHLHPKWQRTIMSYLSERFINTQFIVTAHSPLIVQAAEQANIVVLKREGDSVTIHQQEKDVQGWRIDQLLTSDLFDLGSARSPFYENKLAQRRQILSKPELTDEDQAQLKVLEAEIGDLPTAETPEDIAAMDIIRRAAELLKTSA
ncbi:MAG: ATP-binding protein [Methylovulum sp.]|uniref:AAA family ATPase n=1 Tax=Methylovulum sp. TaxID=1916980 RepID=UPI0026300C97|nr:ATP-binding protein [Methylovulum sp.]MDD2724311.1 ATP-binding protein [Methylovulum sp.]MDD5122956.1 ATP-binding protein [Methylovulum sp.]